MNNKSFVEETNCFSKKLTNSFFKKIFVFDEIDSTNNKAKELALKNEPEGTLVLSKIQKKGRGRFDHIWRSPEGGLYLSIILRPTCKPEKTTLLTFLASLAVSETIKEYGLLPYIKWPNDVIIKNKKVSGILIELEAKNKKVDFVIIGIGINLNTDVSVFSKNFISTSISAELGHDVDFYSFLQFLLKNFEKYYLLFFKERYNEIINFWKEKSDTIGKEVKIINFNSEITGRVVDVDESGFLIIKTSSGQIKKITSGDCVYLR